ncbi:NAD(P)/FAD-dependent oxidoreductase [Pseudomonas vancouverensis]|uniref:FAD-binding oxidoreductase n=1 Tax=Pseudomonas vancouverensis TaxID=95300 RepID=A0A4R4K938_PSEVA|nr:FAD-binding oxidoreductase [Pseudomonas vancouverensis]KAB0491254.1 FAD-binding oxidoreductase [Pseudomonas vancouverensis]TDB64287.1 FAD-binding oxidoreductase [Pseudomonas vancouverensis]
MNIPEAAFASASVPRNGGLPHEVDVAIIGAGLMGCACAYYLSKAGAKVLLLDKSALAGQQSSRAWGFVRQQSRDEAEVPMMQASIEIWRSLEHELQTDLGWRNDGCLFVAANEAERDGYESWLSVARSFALDTVMLSPREVTKKLPGYAVPQLGGLFTASDGQAEPTLVARAFAKRARELGAQIVEQCGAKGIDVAAGQVVGVETELGYVKAKTVVCAAGVTTFRLLKRLGINLPQQLVRGTVARTTPGPALSGISTIANGVGFRQRLDGSFNIADDAHVDVDMTLGHLRALHWYAPSLWAHRKSFRFNLNGACLSDLQQRMPWSEASRLGPGIHQRNPLIPPNDKGLGRAMHALKAAFPGQVHTQIADRWAGGIDVLPDGIPVIDANTTPRGLAVATGFCGHGFAMGPIVGKTLADWIDSGDPGLDMHQLRLSRFAEGDVKPPSSLF